MRNIFPFWPRSLLSVSKEKISKFKVLKTQAMKIMLYIKFSKKKKKQKNKKKHQNKGSGAYRIRKQ